MLVIYKGNIALRVQYGERAVWIQPVVSKYDNRSLLTTLARNEELLAQVHLSQQEITNTREELAGYFRKKGWLVKIPGQQEPQA
jgi:hypothetical protein